MSTGARQLTVGSKNSGELAKRLGNVSQACKIMGYSRDSFYRFQEAYDKGGEIATRSLVQRGLPEESEKFCTLEKISFEKPALAGTLNKRRIYETQDKAFLKPRNVG